MKRLVSFIAVLTVLALGFSGCATMSTGQQTGATLGAALGAGIPLLLEESTKVIGGGALIGAAAGAVLGGVFEPKAATTTVYASPPLSGLEAIKAQAKAKEMQKILRKRQRVAEKAAKEEGIVEARDEMAE